jgi:hypothetical protein
MSNFIIIYLNSIKNYDEAYKKRSIKYIILTSFYNSINDYPKMITTENKQFNAKFNVMLSFFNQFVGQYYMKNDFYRKGENWLFFEANPLARYRKHKYSIKNEYIRVCFDSVYHSKSKYIETINRWPSIQKQTGIEVLPWRENGKHILIILNSCKYCGYSMKNECIHTWVNNTIKEIRKEGCKREIRLRFKCQYEDISIINENMIKISHKNEKYDYIDPIGNMSIGTSNKEELLKELIDAWASIVYSTSACVISIIMGIPVFVGSKDAITYDISSNDFSKIEDPYMPNRDDFLHKLSNQLWSLKEIKKGLLWTEVKKHYNI